jgi:membrane-associated phospholipid phosphatase
MMENLIESSIPLIVSIQNIGNWFELPMKFFTFLGSEEFFLFLLPILYWCVDSKLGWRIGLMLVVSNGVVGVLKLAFADPRPYWVSAQIQPLVAEASFGAPSGHAEIAAGVWGITASYYKKRSGWLLAGLIIFLIGFSRIYLGAHFPHDVLLGWLFGVITLSLFLTYWDRVESAIKTLQPASQIILAFSVSLFFVILGILAWIPLWDFSLPAEWIANSLRSGEQAAPVSLSGVITTAGTLFGLSVGAVWMKQYQPSGPIAKRAISYVVGLVGVILFWVLLGQVFPRDESLIAYILRFIRYVLVGGWVTGGAPWLFEKLGLAEKTN